MLNHKRRKDPLCRSISVYRIWIIGIGGTGHTPTETPNIIMKMDIHLLNFRSYVIFLETCPENPKHDLLNPENQIHCELSTSHRRDSEIL